MSVLYDVNKFHIKCVCLKCLIYVIYVPNISTDLFFSFGLGVGNDATGADYKRRD